MNTKKREARIGHLVWPLVWKWSSPCSYSPRAHDVTETILVYKLCIRQW